MNVLIIDDHALIREGIALMVKSIRPDAGVWLAPDYSNGMELARRQKMDFAFLDLELPDESGLNALGHIKLHNEMTSVVVVSAHEDRDTVLRALELGATAYVPKSTNSERMRNVVKDLFDGKVCLPESVLATEHKRPGLEDRCHDWQLTHRQKEVLALLILGLPNKVIARKLNIVESTVKIHVSAILKELKVATRTQAILAVARQGITLPVC